MKIAAALIALCLTCVAHAQTRIASAIEIRQMEEAAREGGDSATRIAAYINLGDLRIGLNELAAAERDFKLALEIADQQRIDAWRLRDMGQYSLACSWMGVALGRLNRGPEAFAILEEAVRYAGNARGIWNPYSVAMYRLDRQEKGIGTGRIAVAISERNASTGRVSEHVLLELNIDRFALAQALLLTEEEDAENEAEQILLRISESLESDKFASLRKNLAKKEAFEIFTAPTTDAGIFLSLFNRVHMRLAWLYEKRKQPEKAAAEFKAVLSRRSDEPIALSGLARVAATAEERDRYLILSLDANPFAEDVVNDYVKHVASGKASPAVRTGSVGSLVRLAIQQLHANDLRRAQATLKELLAAHPNNDVLWALLSRAEVGPGSARPSFLKKPADLVDAPTEADLLAVLRLFAGNALNAEDLATMDRMEFRSDAVFEGAAGEAFERGTIQRVPFRFQSAAKFRGISATARQLRIVYRILGATTIDGNDALLLEPVRAESEP